MSTPQPEPVRTFRHKRYLTTEEAGEYIGIATGTLEQWRHFGKGPAYHKFGRSVRYKPEELDRWADKQIVLTANG